MSCLYDVISWQLSDPSISSKYHLSPLGPAIWYRTAPSLKNEHSSTSLQIRPTCMSTMFSIRLFTVRLLSISYMLLHTFNRIWQTIHWLSAVSYRHGRLRYEWTDSKWIEKPPHSECLVREWASFTLLSIMVNSWFGSRSLHGLYLSHADT